jgi:phosphoadenosine phosphosulfate reductase
MSSPAKKPPPKIPPHPLAVIRRARDEFGVREAIVGISCGKDSIAAAEVCREHLDRIEGYFLYIVPGLSFQENYLAYLERRYSIHIHRLPHFQLAAMLRGGTLRFNRRDSLAAANIKPRHIDAHLRKITGIQWIATGEKAIDSVERNAMIRNVAGISLPRRRIWPLAYWSHSTVYNYLKTRQIALAPEYSLSVTSSSPADRKTRSFGGLQYRDVCWIEEKYPDDYKKITTMFPMLPAQILRYRQREELEQQPPPEQPEQPEPEQANG